MSDGPDIRTRVQNTFPVRETPDGDIVSLSETTASDAEPAFRKYQQEAIIKTLIGLEIKDVDVVLLDAPTGAGKSLLLYTAAKAYIDNLNDGPDFHNSGIQLTGRDTGTDIPEPIREGAFITTPLNSLVDQLRDDEFIQDNIITLKGRNNYSCIHPEDKGTKVNEAICQREEDFDCEYKMECPYYGRKYDALQQDMVVTNMSYLMAEGMIPGTVEGTFGDRDILVIDECQKLEDFAMNFISFTISKRTVPSQVWQNVTIPDKYNQEWADEDEDVEDDMEFLIGWLNDEVLEATGQMIEYLETQPMLSQSQSNDLENLQQFEMRVENFLDDIENNDWIAQIQRDVKKNRPNTKKINFSPIEIGRFLDNLLWSRADKIILSSATIPKGNWLNEIGLGDKKVGKVDVESTFPLENRQIITDQAVGKMTYDKRDENAWPMAKRIKEIAEFHEGKGMIHCRSYSIAAMLKEAYVKNGQNQWFKNNCMVQDKDRREESLEEWINSDKQVFFSVAMDEGVDLEGDKARWQVLAKTLYKSMNDKRVKYRVQTRNEWDWYNRHAAIQIAQAYGRAVRGPEDWAVFYILDKSANILIDRNEHLFPDWFMDAIRYEGEE